MKIDPQRSLTMRAVKSKDTTPEIAVRQLLHSLGYRYRLHRRDLPGSPDIVFGSRRKVIFVHGCFWHGHNCRRGSRKPKTNSNYWENKISGNVARDESTLIALRKSGWNVLIVWECEIRETNLSEILVSFLGPTGQCQ